MADGEDIQPLVCDNGTGMVKVYSFLIYNDCTFLRIVCAILIYIPYLDGPKILSFWFRFKMDYFEMTQ